MRLWHYKLIKEDLLPKSQLLAQWRELNSIFKKQDNHILINYIYNYSKEDLYAYTYLVLQSMIAKGIKYKFNNSFNEYFNNIDKDKALYSLETDQLFKDHQNDRYLIQCFYNLQEKYDRGQKDFNKDLYNRLENFINNYFESDNSLEY